MKRTLLAVAGALFAMVASAAPPPAEELGAKLVGILRRDDIRDFAALTAGLDVPGLAFESVRDTIDEYDCISVSRHTTITESESEDRLVLRVEMAGSASTIAEWHPVRPLPAWWHVEARRIGGEWRMVEAIPGERQIARLMIAAPTLEDAQCVLTSAEGIDPAAAVRYYAYDLETDLTRTEHAVRLAAQLDDVYTEIFTLRLLAMYRHQHGAPAEAVLEPVLRAEELARRRGTATELAEALFSIGVAHVLHGDMRNAIPPFLAAGELVEETEEPLRSIKSLHMAAWSWENLRNLQETLRLYNRVEELSRRYGWYEGETLALLNRAVFYHDIGNIGMARHTLQQALRSSEAMARDDFIAHAAASLAVAARKDRKHDEEVAYFRRAIQHDNMKQVMFHALLARALIRGEQYDEAQKVLDRAAGFLRDTDPATSHAHLLLARGELALALGRTGEAVRLAREGVGYFTASGGPGTNDLARAEALIELGMALRADGQRDEAVRVLQEAVVTIEAVRHDLPADDLTRLVYFDDFLTNAYAVLVEMLVERGKVEEAFRVAESMKGRALRDALARGRIDLSGSMTAAEREREGQLAQAVVDLNRALSRALRDGAPTDALRGQLATARVELEAFRTEMTVAHPSLRQRAFASEAEGALPEAWASVTAIEYVLTESGAIAFCVTRGAGGEQVARAVRLPVGADELRRETNRLADLVSRRSISWRAPARRLHDWLVAPLEPWLAGAKAICIIPDGVLWRVPFQALLARNGSRVVDRHAVFYSYSLALLRSSFEDEAPRSTRLLAFGNPAGVGTAQATLRSMFRDVPLGPLPDAETEVRSIAALYPASGTRVYVGDTAREAVLKREAGAFDILHVAAHAVVDDRAPMYSAILLAAGKDEATEDGLLEAREIVDLSLDADLAVLSACATGAGAIDAGEGVVGLAWAFSAAGCPTTVVSQWKAESRATSLLMIEFHRRLVTGDSTAEALRRAQLAIARNPRYAHPFYWAPFIAIGAAERALQP